jgi:hypothetical protein
LYRYVVVPRVPPGITFEAKFHGGGGFTSESIIELESAWFQLGFSLKAPWFQLESAWFRLERAWFQPLKAPGFNP